MSQYLIAALYALLPLTLLTSYNLPSAVFYALLALSLVLLARRGFAGAWQQTRRYRWLLASYSLCLLVVAASSVYHGQWAGANSEGAIRVLAGLWVLLLALPHVNPQTLRQHLWGVLLAGVVATGIVVWLTITDKVRPSTPGVILTTYTSIMLLLAAFSVYSLKWSLSSRPRLEAALKVVVAVIVFCGFLLSLTRTGFLGLPVLIGLAVVLFAAPKKYWRTLGAVIAVTSVVAVAALANDGLRNRVLEGFNELKACQGETSTAFNSMCIRVQLWRTAIDAGTHNPWFGLGNGGEYAEYLKKEGLEKGLVSQRTLEEGYGEPHNDVLSMFAGFGYPGALALLLVYLAPCAWFFPRLFSSASPQARAAAAMGLAVCLGFLLFGLTETMFRRMNTLGLYTAWVALFMVLSDPAPQAQSNRRVEESAT